MPEPKNTDPSRLLRRIPAMNAALEHLERDAFLAAMPRPLVKEAAEAHLNRLRADVLAGRAGAKDLDRDILLAGLTRAVREAVRPKLRRVLNATGVVVHTNLGRSLLADEAAEAVDQAMRHYSNLEFDLSTGKRGSRYSLVEEMLCRLTGAEAALVVNNNAAAVFLVLETLARGREVVVSRGQLVEIGGSFRIPDVMARSGAVLREVGTTNRTHLADYERAVTDETAAFLRVHTSNFRILGFTKEVSAVELVALGRRYGLPVFEDLGSGNLFDLEGQGLFGEPTVQSVVAAGVDVVSFSGDKVLGGPQAGIIVGRRRLLDAVKSNPLNRALRIDKMTLAGLEATLRLYLDPEEARRKIPTLRMVTANPETLKTQAGRLARLLRQELGKRAEVSTRKSVSRVGGGSFPEKDLPTTLAAVRLPDVSLEDFKAALLDGDPPLVGRVEDGLFCLDPRTLDPSEHGLAALALVRALDRLER